jgi:uncharacterized protein (DUF1697 family)
MPHGSSPSPWRRRPTDVVEILPTGTADSYAVFLRGVNVGGITIRMADLREELSALPVGNVATVLASGNVTCSSALGAAALKARVEGALRRRFGYEAWVVVVGAPALAAIAASVPRVPPPVDGGTRGTADEPSADTEAMHTYITFFSGRAELGDFLDEARGLEEQPDVLAGGSAVAWFSPRGRSTDVPLAKLLSRSRFASTSTTRNINTVDKVLHLLGQAR